LRTANIAILNFPLKQLNHTKTKYLGLKRYKNHLAVWLTA